MDAFAREPYRFLNFPVSSNIPPANIFLVGSSPYLAVYGEHLSRPSFETCGEPNTQAISFAGKQIGI